MVTASAPCSAATAMSDTLAGILWLAAALLGIVLGWALAGVALFWLADRFSSIHGTMNEKDDESFREDS